MTQRDDLIEAVGVVTGFLTICNDAEDFGPSDAALIMGDEEPEKIAHVIAFLVALLVGMMRDAHLSPVDARESLMDFVDSRFPE